MANPADTLTDAVHTLTYAWPAILRMLANILLLSGADDFVPFLLCLRHWIKQRGSSARPTVFGVPNGERRIAIFVPCWKESEVIGDMVRRNLAAIRYRNFDIFLGVYPNDTATLQVAEDLARAYRNVHVSVCPHPGPTSKADCLNWIYCRTIRFEKETAIHFDTVVLHDAEDLIHPEAFRTINRERVRHAMVQVPVLPLPTPFGEFTHGVYCDEFAEFQIIDMRARGYSGSFTPSNGVGTGVARHILEQLGEERGQIFDPASLTEDYEIGVYIHRLGYSQIFVPLQLGSADLVATREYFPRKWGSAVRQRTRWVTGIALQGWERDGWRGTLGVRYWFWRDRKGLLTNPLGLLTNLLFVAGALDLAASTLLHRSWQFGVDNPEILRLCTITATLQSFRLLLRMCCVSRIYGLRYALGVPIRSFTGNFINGVASLAALRNFALSKLYRRPLVWLKTEHSYPQRESMSIPSRDLHEVLAGSGIIAEARLAAVPGRKLVNNDLADYLLTQQALSEDEICSALSLQSGFPSTRVDIRAVKPRTLQSLPLKIQKQFNVVPFRVENGRLLVAGTRVPDDAFFQQVRTLTRLSVEYQLVSKRNLEQLQALV